MRQRYSADEWIELFREQAASDLTVKEFCDAIGVSTNTFYSWQRKLRTAPPVNALDVPASVAFLPLDVVPPGRNVTAPIVTIDLPCGAVVRLPGDADVLATVLTVLLSSGEAS